MKKLLSLILAVSLLLTGSALADELRLKYLDPSLYPVAEGAELDIWCGQDGNVANYEVNPQTAALEELTGVKINWTTAPGTQEDMNVMFNLHIASGNYPDMYLNTLSTADIIEYANDVFIPLNDYIENTRWIKEYLEAMPEIREAITAPDGNIYSLWHALPETGDKDSNANPYKLWIYLPWLEASGMDMPETVDEFRELLRYFRDHDMNGNGDPNDEIPMMGSFAYDHEGSDPTYAIMQAFQLTPSNFLWVDEEHNVSCVAITDDFREGLSYLNSMYEEGLIAEDIYALTLNEYRDVVNVTKPEDQVVGVAAAPYWMRFVTVSIFGERAYDEFTYMPVLKRDENTPAQTYTRKSGISLNGVVTTACEDPQLAIDWLDACLDPEINRVTNLGNEGDYWTRVSEEGELPIVSMTVPGTDLKDGGSVNEHCYGNWVFPAIPSSYYDFAYEEGSAAQKSDQVQRAANREYAAAGVGDYMPASVWCTDSDLLTEMADLQTNIENAISTAYAEFILGRRDVDDDAEWEEYKQSLEDLGLSRYLEVVYEVNFGS